jgi:arylsulfatase A-like enzyme
MKPNFLVLVLDALRADSMSCYGYEKATTPNLDGFASQNILFRHCYSNATWTIPTHASMLSGLYLSQHRIENTRQNRRFHRDIVPLPIALNHNGYRTAAFSHNPLFGPAHHFDYFDEFYDLDTWLVEPTLLQKSRKLRSWPRFVNATVGYLEKTERPRRLFDALLQWMDRQEEPFFVMANLINIHYPWAPSPALLWQEMGVGMRALLSEELRTPRPWHFNPGLKRVTEQHKNVWRQLYDASIRHVDREWGRFLRKLQMQKGWDNLVLVVTADHGELLGDHRDIVGHMLSLHDRILHVPLILRHPDYDGRQVVNNVVQTLDLYSSVLEWAGAKHKSIPDAQLRCRSFSAALNSPYQRFAFAEEDYTDSYDLRAALLQSNPSFDSSTYPRRQVAVHGATHKLIWKDSGEREFYDVETDPSETNNLFPANQDDPTVVEMQNARDQWEQNLEKFPPQEIVDKGEEQDPMVLERLRQLGYVD